MIYIFLLIFFYTVNIVLAILVAKRSLDQITIAALDVLQLMYHEKNSFSV